MTRSTGLERLGRRLFRWRGLIGFAAYLVVLWLGRPSAASLLAGLPLLLAGSGLRFWAMGHIGSDARAGEMGARRLVTGGPYRWFRLSRRALAGHPLYAGNFLLVVGMLTALWGPVVLRLLVVGLFLVEYGLIARAEERELARRSWQRPGNAPPAGLPKERTRFEARRALPEWRTVAAVVLAYGFAVMKWRFFGPGS